MNVRTRFAPSPTGNLHIGGARTALYCYLYAKAFGGKFILRIEDTDLERSEKKYELSMIEDLKWCGIEFDEGPDMGGNYGPYRQSERLDIYKKYAMQLIEEKKAYYCFLTDAELDVLTEKANAEKASPHKYHNKFQDYPIEEAKKRIASGESFSIRFKNPQKKYRFNDLVRGEVEFNEDMVGDFVIIRSNGFPVYNFCCVIDDYLMKISHVFRAEEHLNNTVRQLMIYEALNIKPPFFGHCSLLVGEDRQKLSKRHGATSVVQYRNEHYLPEALMNYLCLLGWSHPEEKDIFLMDDIVSIFNEKRFNKAPALYDIAKLKYFNEQHLRKMSTENLILGFASVIDKNSAFHKQNKNWQNQFCEFYRDKVQLFTDIIPLLNNLMETKIEKTNEVLEILNLPSTAIIKNLLETELNKKAKNTELKAIELEQWMNKVKDENQIKGKPLFMGFRVLLTGHVHGPDLKTLFELTPIEIFIQRLKNF